jgi:hypothetical protein
MMAQSRRPAKRPLLRLVSATMGVAAPRSSSSLIGISPLTEILARPERD